MRTCSISAATARLAYPGSKIHTFKYLGWRKMSAGCYLHLFIWIFDLPFDRQTPECVDWVAWNLVTSLSTPPHTFIKVLNNWLKWRTLIQPKHEPVYFVSLFPAQTVYPPGPCILLLICVEAKPCTIWYLTMLLVTETSALQLWLRCSVHQLSQRIIMHKHLNTLHLKLLCFSVKPSPIAPQWRSLWKSVINVKIGNTKVTATLRFMIFVAQCSLEH